MAKAINVANFFIESATSQDDKITNLKLNKLLYFAQALSLVKRGKPLFEEPIEAWSFGPVVKSIYHEFKIYGNKTIKKPTTDDYADDFNEEEEDILVETMLQFGQYTASALVNKSHAKGGPWDTAVNNEGIISETTIRDYYQSRLASEKSECFDYSGIDIVVPKRDAEGKALLPADIYNDW